ncbi:MAG TPA: copper resistance protein NlpE [Phnomibacter sp.]|nr:copper resistance protein NlpE [Phnomibacter sp.]
MRTIFFKNILIGMAAMTLAACGGQGEPAAGETQPDQLVAIDSEHNAKLSLDYAGTYKGTTPCADCEGIEVELTINGDGTYTLSMNYLGKGDGTPFSSNGTYSWAADGNTIELDGISDGPSKYKVGENQIWQLDMEGNVVEGELADKYILTKTN